MKQIFIRGLVIALCLPFIWGSVTSVPKEKETKRESKRIVPPPCTFYDGEGNKIPLYAVDWLVRSQFVLMDVDKVDTLTKYFYFTKHHMCPFRHCPMRTQVRFHGCGSCIWGSDCWMLDWIHWEHPTWSYDQCEELFESEPSWKANSDSIVYRYFIRR